MRVMILKVGKIPGLGIQFCKSRVNNFFGINNATHRDRNRQNKKGFDNGNFHPKISSMHFERRVPNRVLQSRHPNQNFSSIP